MRELKKLDKSAAREILDYLDKKIAVLDDATTTGKALSRKLATLWRYRLGDMYMAMKKKLVAKAAIILADGAD